MWDKKVYLAFILFIEKVLFYFLYSLSPFMPLDTGIVAAYSVTEIKSLNGIETFICLFLHSSV